MKFIFHILNNMSTGETAEVDRAIKKKEVNKEIVFYFEFEIIFFLKFLSDILVLLST